MLCGIPCGSIKHPISHWPSGADLCYSQKSETVSGICVYYCWNKPLDLIRGKCFNISYLPLSGCLVFLRNLPHQGPSVYLCFWQVDNQKQLWPNQASLIEDHTVRPMVNLHLSNNDHSIHILIVPNLGWPVAEAD